MILTTIPTITLVVNIILMLIEQLAKSIKLR